jgi:Transposase domain (DUF772)
MEAAVPWARLVERLAPLYPKGERGRPPIGLERMLRVYFVRQWYGLSDEGLEGALYDSQALARIIHRGAVWLRDAEGQGAIFRGIGDAGDWGLKLRRGVCSGASGPVDYGGSLAMRPTRAAKPAW